MKQEENRTGGMKMKVTKEELAKYNKVKTSGKVNIWDVDAMMKHTRLSRLKILEIMKKG